MKSARGRRPSRRRFVLLAGLAALAGCADRNVGREVEADQLYYPVGIASLDGEAPRLVVHSTNYDQRFQSGQVSLLAADVLVDAVLARVAPSTAGACPPPVYLPGFGPDVFGTSAVVDRVRVPGVGGELLAVPDPENASASRIFVTNRFDSTVIFIRRDAAGLDCALDCRGGSDPECAPGGERYIDNTDCTEAHLTITEAEDPFALAQTIAPNGQRRLAVGHLFGYVENLQSYGVVSVFDEDAIASKPESGGAPFLYALRFEGARGVSGVASTSTAIRPQDNLLAFSGPDTAPLLLSSVELRAAGQGARDGSEVVPVVKSSVRFDRVSNATGSRGLALTPEGDRAVVSLRFDEENGVSFNSALAIVDLTGDELRSFPATEVGQELGTPAIRPRTDGEPLLAYVGDIRSDKVWVVDVTRSVPRVVGEFSGRAQRTLDDGTVIASRLFDAPSGFAFVRRADRTYAFVTNFSNSTLALLDVTDPNPRNQCYLARLGRDVDANGESEAERQR